MSPLLTMGGARSVGRARRGAVADGGVTPDLSDDFSTYTDTTDFRADPLTLYDGVEETLTNTYANVNLDTGLGYGGRTQSMRISYLDATAEGGSGTSGRCTNAGHGAFRTVDMPVGTTEVWFEIYNRFSTDFNAGGGSWGCTSAANMKLFFGGVSGPSTSRFVLDIFDGQWDFGYPDNEQIYSSTAAPRPDSMFDGNWHQVRFHWRVSSATDVADGIAKFWLNGTLRADYTNVVINRTAITDLYLGQTRNQGSDGDTEWNIGLWRVWRNGNNPGW